ncbi:DNA mismatch endonuclease Vsr [Chitinophaga sp. MAH-28]|uniref:DNA mismatch endonuclease Vsr n=2 Tax=Chitinophagaceae TaxID=563835 RepID=A0ABS3YJX6_9BACT|nr:DNA mismatch endonuclease Vsr [Chitinophaga chungangae]
MSRIKGKNTKPEMMVRKFLFSQGLRYKLHDKTLPGKPDMVFPKFKTALFINGCFWHGHENCKYYVVPKTRTDWWQAKINGNRIKDYDSIKKLEQQGWKVIVIWECELKHGKADEKLKNIANELINK